MKKKVCKTCKIFVDGKNCPICKNNLFSTNWKGRVYVLDVKKSAVAEKMEVEVKGEYAVKI